jgi:lipopolysaccharide transport system ATP-binding protein
MMAESKSMSEEALVKVDGVSKKFCRSLKRSLWYGVQSITDELLFRTQGHSRNSHLRTGEFWALKNINFELHRGECLGLIGRNGAGKSTLLKILNGLIKPDQGKVTVRGRIGALIELGAGFNPVLTGLENIYINAAVLGISKSEITKKLDDIIEFSELRDFVNTPVRNYSSGMKVRLGFAIAAQMEPDILIIDEVLAVGDVGFKAKCFNALSTISKNTAMIFVSHQMPQVARIATKLLLLDNGEAEYYGPEVARGINSYYAQFKEENFVITGSGEAELLDIEFSSKNSRRVESINYLDDLTIRMNLRVDKSIRHPAVYVTFLNQTLQSEMNVNSRIDNFIIDNKTGTIRLRLHIPKVNLNPGIHFVSIGIHQSRPFKVLKQYYAYKKLLVKGDFVSVAPVQVKGEWSADRENIGQ